MSQHVISVKVENKFGVLARVAGLFSARGYNIDSLSVSKTEHEDISVMTIVVTGDDRILEQVKKQLNKLIDVIKVSDHSQQASIHRELALVKINCPAPKRGEILQLADLFQAEVADVALKSITFAVKGDSEKIDRFIELTTPYGIKESMRTGLVSILKDKE
ncbi:MAG TPA: acetolactate synthase small subunit [Spirochaetota bacterium]|nr:acetolactate synthase small subunit [Spirochaetota bacterium]HPF05346.1 acetolactate synthase small subunit [Spirochaetota bacterium]HPJ41776.1 acetolactate synthase small subunit [Spirochaetota bacterium]HPR39166.1 acetolactate synthase small subunit [Spirochaetota bacterium]HRX46984.1 acetolactate synthase small subunit [Spirochaetota bacterium]